MAMNRRDFLNIIPFALASCAMTPTPAPLPYTIQGAIDTAARNGKALVKVPAGTYVINQTIQCAYNVSLDLTGVTLQAGADVDIIHAAHRANITGGFIDCSNVTFTHTALLLDGVNKFDMTFPTHFKDLKFIGNWQSEGATGNAIRLQAGTGFIQGVIFDNIGMSYFNDGLRLQHSGAAWVNGNQFTNLTFMICRHAVQVDGEGNTFVNIQYQPSGACESALYCTGGANMFTNFMVWDWDPKKTAIEFTAAAMRNTLSTVLYRSYIVDAGWNNVINTPAN